MIARARALTAPGELSAALEHPSARVVVAAASAIKQHEVRQCGDALVRAFLRLVNEPEDPQCRAKAAVLEAIMVLEAERERDAYLLGRRYVQLEAQWGPPVDTAAEVRGLCALGLVRSRHPEAAILASEALADAELRTRLAAAHALAEAPPAEALPVLRLKIASEMPSPRSSAPPCAHTSSCRDSRGSSSRSTSKKTNAPRPSHTHHTTSLNTRG